MNKPTKQPKRGRPITNFKVPEKSSEIGTKVNETRATFIINKDLLLRVQSISYWDRISIKQVLNNALVEYISKYEKKNGNIKLVVKR